MENNGIEWKKIGDDNMTVTRAANVPNGVLIRVSSKTRQDNGSIVYVPGVRVEGVKLYPREVKQ
jgi:hypothetical protein